MRILITGGCGFLGHHLVEHFLKEDPGTEVVVIDRLTYASSGFDRLRDIRVYDDRRIRVLGANLAEALPEGVVREVGDVDFIVHAAAETHVDNSIVDPLPFLHANVVGVHHVLMHARAQRRLRRIFLVSTDEVYGPAPFGAPGFKEEDRFAPTNPYAAAKVGGEALGMAYGHSFGIPVTIATAMNFIGERQHPEKFVPKVIGKVLAGEQVTIHADASRTVSGTRFYLHCRTFAYAISFLMGRAETLPRKVHVSGRVEVSNLDLAQRIAGIVGRPLEYDLVDFHSSRPGHDLRYALDSDRIAALGWREVVPFEESLERTVRWYLREENRRWLYLRGPTG